MKNEVCKNGHPLHGLRRGRAPTGNCRTCTREAGIRYRKRCQAALKTIEVFQRVGVQFSNTDGTSRPADVVANEIAALVWDEARFGTPWTEFQEGVRPIDPCLTLDNVQRR